MVEDSQLKKEKIAIKGSAHTHTHTHSLSLSLSTLGSITCVLLYTWNSQWQLTPHRQKIKVEIGTLEVE